MATQARRADTMIAVAQRATVGTFLIHGKVQKLFFSKVSVMALQPLVRAICNLSIAALHYCLP